MNERAKERERRRRRGQKERKREKEGKRETKEWLKEDEEERDCDGMSENGPQDTAEGS